MSDKPDPFPKNRVYACARGTAYLYSPYIVSLILALLLAIFGMVKLSVGPLILAVTAVGLTVKELLSFAKLVEIDDEKLRVTTTFEAKDIPWSAVRNIKLRFYSPMQGWTQYVLITDRGPFTLPMSLDDAAQLVTFIADRVAHQSYTPPPLVGAFSPVRVAFMWVAFFIITAFFIATSVYVMPHIRWQDVVPYLGALVFFVLSAGYLVYYMWWALSDLVIYLSMNETHLELRTARKRTVLLWDQISPAMVSHCLSGLSIKTASGSKFVLPERIDYYDVVRDSLASGRFIKRTAAPRD